MKTLFFILTVFSSLTHAGQCPESAAQKYGSYYNEPGFRDALESQIELLAGRKISKLQLNEHEFPGDSYSRLDSALIPSGLTQIGVGMYDVMFRTNDTSTPSLILESKGKSLDAYFRFDDWSLCSAGKIVQPWVSIGGQVEGKFITFVWDYEQQQVIGPNSMDNLVSCSTGWQEEAPMPFTWGFGMGVRQTAERGRYFVGFGMGEFGTFALTNCRLSSSSSLICEGDEIHGATISWMGLVQGKPDAMELEITGRNGNGTKEVLIQKTRYTCK